MVFLMMQEHIEAIRRHDKTQTRRRISLYKKGPKKGQRVPPKRVGSVQQLRTTLFGKPEAFVKILRQWEEPLNQISETDAKAEGGYTPMQYIAGMIEMHQGRVKADSVLYCYEFECYEPPLKFAEGAVFPTCPYCGKQCGLDHDSRWVCPSCPSYSCVVGYATEEQEVAVCKRLGLEVIE